MSNYIVEDEYRDFDIPSESKFTKKPNYLTIAIIILAVLILIIIIASKIKTVDTYTSLENNMVTQAENYISKWSTINKEIYIDAKSLGVVLPSKCSALSGVIYKEGNYTPYLICSDYKSKIVNNNGVNLVGNDIIFLQRGKKYYELGAVDSSNVGISGVVNTNQPGVYNVYYISKISNLMSIRKVIVIDNTELVNLFPIIDVSQEEVNHELGQEFTDKVMAFDKTDGDLTKNIIKINNVNQNEIGVYNNIYSVTNSNEYTTMEGKTVTVLNSEDNTVESSIIANLSDENITNNNVKIMVRVVGVDFDYVLLPNDSLEHRNEFDYEVEENGEYLFVVVNKDGSRVSKVVRVSNIDKTIPTGTCKAGLYSTRTTVSVSISSFNYIVGYNYTINNVDSGYISSSNYNSGVVTDSDVYVTVRDYIGNESKIKCVSEKKYTYNPNGYTDKTYMTIKSRLYIPLDTALSKKGYSINDLNRCIYSRVKEAGPGTRYGVVAASYGLIDCMYKMTGYVLAYDHTGGKVSTGNPNYCTFNSDICGKLGVNSKWGRAGGTCNSSQCYLGLNCATFVRWSMCNGGMDLCSKGEAGAYSMVSTTYFPGADGVYIQGDSVKYYSGNNLTNYSAKQLVRMIKPGDVVARQRIGDTTGATQHAFVVIGVDNTGIYTANDGYYVQKISFNSMTDGDMVFRILFLDNYYAKQSNRNSFYG